MTDPQLEELLAELNSDPDSSKFILTQLAEDIYFGKVWFNLPWENQTEYQGDKYYFINRQDFGFVGSVEATNSELHAFLLPEFRGKGIMSLSLRETILPHLFWYNQTDRIRITIDQNFHGTGFGKVERSALMAGFQDKNTIVDSLFEYFAYKKDYPEFKFQAAKIRFSAEKEFQFLHDRINSIHAQLQYMRERYELMFNVDDQQVVSIQNTIKEFEARYENLLRLLL
ncbi:MAG: hypothetical protein WAO52_08865 [Prolixibacteraceae bacterium]